MIHRARLVTLVCTSFVAAAAFAGPVAASPQPYAFTKIADNSGAPFTTVKPPSINDSGMVAFRANLAAGGQGIFSSKDGVTTPIALSTGGDFCCFGQNPAINAAGTVAFIGNGNDATGTVAYKGLIPPVPPARSFSMAGICTSAGVTIAEGPLVPDFQNLALNKISMNAAGSVLFFADFAAGSGLYIGTDASAANRAAS